MFQMRCLYFALHILMILISNASATKCGVIAPDCQVFGDGTIQWEQLKKCPLMPICQRGFRFISNNVNGETRCCCISESSNSSNYQQLPQNCELKQPCSTGKWWNHNLCRCEDIPTSPDIPPSSEIQSSEVPCIKGCLFDNMELYKDTCICCPEFTYWDPSLEKCEWDCDFQLEGCEESKRGNTPGFCSCNKCHPGYFKNPSNPEGPPRVPGLKACSETCDWEEPCSTGKLWNHYLCKCADTADPPSSEIPSSE